MASAFQKDTDSRVLGLKSGADVFLSKPFDPNDEIYEFLSHISNSGNKTLQILNSLLLLTNVRKADAPYETIVMNEVVDETIKRVSEIITESNAKINHPKSWPSSIGYAPWVEEIWVNYISNAIKYGGQSPEITIGADIVMLKGNTIEMVRFWVRDNGLGISNDDQKLLFQQFERLHQAKIKGHGLGLSIVRRIAHKLGGYVGVESELGKGSLFYFTLPKS